MDDLLSDFAVEAAEALREIRAAMGAPGASASVLRRLHGLKGAAACLGLGEIEGLAHQAEGQLAAGTPPRLDRLEAAIAALKALPASHAGPADAAAAFAGLERMARDLGHRLGKRIELVTTGAETPLPAPAAARLRPALLALVRNACDHGVEAPAERAAVGKPALAVIRLSARSTGDGVVIELADDGRGVDAERVRDRSLALGSQISSSADIHRMVFEAGLSTAAALTRLSGRGVGLDLVRADIQALGGEVALTSSSGRGALVTITLPSAPQRRRSAA
jgi:two-component system chemotaxis sensor kinase CheA